MGVERSQTHAEHFRREVRRGIPVQETDQAVAAERQPHARRLDGTQSGQREYRWRWYESRSPARSRGDDFHHRSQRQHVGVRYPQWAGRHGRTRDEGCEDECQVFGMHHPEPRPRA